MSRLVGSGLVMIDVTATTTSALSQMGVGTVLVTCLLSSAVVGLASWMLRSTLWPTYFWEEPAL